MFSIRQATALLWQPVTGVTRAASRTPTAWALRNVRFPTNTRALSASPIRSHNTSSKPPGTNERLPQSPDASESTSEVQTHLSFQMPEPRLSLTFTCTVEACHTRSTHQFTRRSYEKGIVIVQCPGCKNRYVPHARVLGVSSLTTLHPLGI